MVLQSKCDRLKNTLNLHTEAQYNCEGKVEPKGEFLPKSKYMEYKI